jgi:hypothetical protein
MKIFEYKNYTEYINCQRDGYERKKERIWTIKENIKYLCDTTLRGKYLRNDSGRGLCHGVRTGKEVEWFIEYLPGWDIIGSEIGNTNSNYIVQWDFNKENPVWKNKFDFIYSNSFDHSYDLKSTIKVWIQQLKINGLLILEWDKRQEHTGEIGKRVNKTDPVSIKLDEFTDSFPGWFDNAIINIIIDMPVVTNNWRKSIIIERIK